jgi:hypothetical protein
MKMCPYCSAEINAQFNFCVECERQVKCTKCGSDLLPGKSKCLVCGTPTVSDTSPSSGFNEYFFEEDQSKDKYRRQVRLKFSDTAIDKAGQYLAEYILPLAPKEARGPVTEVARTIPALETGQEAPASVGAAPGPAPVVQPAQEPRDEYAWVDDYIFRDGDRLEIKRLDFKGKSKAEQKRRVTAQL